MKKNNNKIHKGNKKKYSRKSHHRYHHLGGSSFEQKGVAAQLRPSIPQNSTLRKKLNEIVHSGDFYESKERNSFLNLDNEFDPEAQIALNEAVDYINNKKDLSGKIKKRVLQGIAHVITPTTRTGYHKTTKKMKTRTPTKNKTVTSAMTKSMNSVLQNRRTKRRTKI